MEYLPGEIVTFLVPAGMGRRGQEYKLRNGRVIMAFPNHCVVNGGGKHGKPYVVNETNFVRKGRKIC